MNLSPATSSHDDPTPLLAVFESSAVAICFLDQTGLFLRANPAFCHLLGYTPQEILGRSWALLDALPMDVSEGTEPRRLRCKDGALLTVLAGFQPMAGEDGGCRLIVTLNQVAAHPAPRSEDFYRNVVENVSEGIFVAQGNRLIFSNPRAAELSGYTQAEMLTLPFVSLLHPEDVPRTVERYHQRLAGEAVERYNDFRLLRKDGQSLLVESSAVAIDWEGQPAVLAFLTDISQRREQEAALIKSEEHYRQVVNNVREGLLVAQDGKIVFANPRLLEITGYRQDELIGISYMADIHPDDRALLADRHLRRLRGEDVDQNYQIRIMHHTSGAIIWAELTTMLIEWEGRPASLSFISDVTERKSLEDSLKQTLDERDTILENSIVGIVFLNPNGRVHWANSAMFQIFGVDRDDSIGKSLESYYPSRDAYLATGAEMAAAARDKTTYEAEIPMKRGDGTLFWAYLSCRVVNPGDSSRGTVCVVMDITKRRQLEEDLNKSEEHYRQVVDNVTECILVVQDGRVVFANQSVLELTGYSAQELFDVPFANAVHPDDRAMVLDHHMRRLHGEKVEQNYKFRLINVQTAAIYWVELSAVMIEWERRPATLSFMTDVTERLRLEESLQQSTAERVRLQTLQFESELKEAEVARSHAEENTRAKSMFLANMSHEIRTPMNAIIGMAHLALRSGLNPKQRDYVEKIHGASISLLGIINDILDFSKIEAGKLDMEQVEFNLDEVLVNVSTVTSGRAHEKDLEYLFRVPPDIPRQLVGDPLRLGQVLINLINNAIKFTEAGEIYVACRQLEITAGRIQLEFVVRDTGIGMSEEQAGKLFRAFSQADESTTRKYGGTGLGLSISKGMVELMGGTIWMHSKPTVGSVIHFTAWFGLAETRELRLIVPQALNGMRILVVDDNPVACLILAESLAALPVEVDMAAGGREALAAIRACDEERPYGVVFTDLRMPEFDGIELICEVRRDLTLQSPPRMVLISDHGRDEMRFRIESALADRFLTKPINASVMVDTLVGLFTPVAHSPSTHIGVNAPYFHDLSVLLVEDNEINQQIAVELMESAGIAVVVARNGRIALDMVHGGGPGCYHLIFMDIQMPEMDGHEATRHIRADGRFDALPIIAMTAHAMVEERDRCLASGMNDHLAKPVNPGALYRIIARWCPTHVHHAEPAEEEAPSSQDDELKIDGINVQDGLVRTLGNRAFYLQMLTRFRDDQSETVAKIRSALDGGDCLSAERLAHTLQGVAGQLGATGVQSMAAQLETEIHRAAAPAALLLLLEPLGHAMHALHAALDQVLSDPRYAEAAATAAAGGFDRKKMQALLQRFAALLRESDGEAIDLLSGSNAAMAAALGNDAHKQIARAARQFDFDGALAALVKCARALDYDI